MEELTIAAALAAVAAAANTDDSVDRVVLTRRIRPAVARDNKLALGAFCVS